MSNQNNFSRRRRGMRFKPKGGLAPNPQKTDRDANQARAEVVAEQGGNERVFDKRYTNEIERSENIAAGLPPQGAPPEPAAPHSHDADKKDFRQPHMDTPAEVQEEKFEPVELKEQPPKGIVEAIKAAATNLVKKVQRLIRPEKRTNKDVVINAETLETRVAVIEEGKLEEFNIERTTEERLVGSIFKGKVRNLEDGLKAAFVDIGFEKNAFLHYWDIVPNQFDSAWKSSSAKSSASTSRKSRSATSRVCIRPAAKSSCRSRRVRSAPKARASRQILFCPDAI